MVILSPMSTLTEIESAVEKLPVAQQEELIRFLTSRLPRRDAATRPYRIRTHPGSVREGIDADKLGQLSEDF